MKKTAWLAWGICGIVTALSLSGIVTTALSGQAQDDPSQLGEGLFFALIPIVFAIVGALILSRQPRNAIGWLMIVPSIVSTITPLLQLEIQSVSTPPNPPPFLLVLAVYLSNTDWIFLIFPLFLIALLFPTGTPPSPRWRWVIWYGVGLVVFFFVVSLLDQTVQPDPSTYGVSWSLVNPIGILPQEAIDQIFGLAWGIALGLLTLFCMAAPFVRYRRATQIEKQQIKWMLFACGVFLVGYVPGVLQSGEAVGLLSDVLNLLFLLGMAAIPIAIGIAILRYRLFDIDVIIRRTLTYALVAALLAVLYFGSVILLQQIFAAVSGQRSEVITVLSTLVIAALFVPLRNRIQNGIDKRFNRNKYNAQQVLQRFATGVRDETDLERLTGNLMEVVNETMQPKNLSVWLKNQGKDANRAR